VSPHCICRRYSGLSLANNFGPGALESSIVLDDLNCTGVETALDACPHSQWGVHNCFHPEDISIACVASTEEQKYGRELDTIILYTYMMTYQEN